jgi:hypothetical protein
VILAFCFCDPLLRELNRSRVLLARAAFAMASASSIVLILRHASVGGLARLSRPTGERQKELVRLSMFGIAPAAAFRDFDEAECLRFPDRRRNQTRRDAVQLDLDPGNDTMGPID